MMKKNINIVHHNDEQYDDNILMTIMEGIEIF